MNSLIPGTASIRHSARRWRPLRGRVAATNFLAFGRKVPAANFLAFSGKPLAANFLLSALIALACVVGHARAYAQDAAPRRIDDVLQVLDHYKPDPEIARRARRAADQLPPDTQDPKALFDFYQRRGRAAARIGRITQQIDDFRLAAQHAGAGGDARDRYIVASDLARAEMTGGNLLQAYKLRESQMDLGRKADTQLEPLMWMVHINAQLGDFAAARDALTKAEAISAAAPSQQGKGRGRGAQARAAIRMNQWTAEIESARGALAQAEGKHLEAQDAFSNAVIAIEEDRADAQRRAQAQGKSGTQLVRYEAAREDILKAHATSLLKLQRFGEAELVNRKALQSAVQRGGRYSVDTGSAVEQLAEIVYQQGRYRDAETLAREAISILEQSGATPESQYLVQARKSLGQLLAVQGKWQDADAEFSKMEEGLKRDPLLMQKIGSGHLAWALALTRLSQPDKAIAMLEPMRLQAASRFGAASFPVAEVRGFLGVAYAGAGRREAALGEFREAVPVLIEQINDQSAASGGAGRTWRLIQVLETYIDLLVGSVQPGVDTPAIDAVAESFRLADVARGGRVQRALSASAARASISDPQLAELARSEQDAEQRVGALNEILSHMLAAPPGQQVPKIIEELRKEIAALRSARRRAKTQIEKRFPDYADLVNPRPPTLEQVRSSLRDGEALVSLYVSAQRTFVWALPKAGNAGVAAAALGEAELIRRVGQIRKALDANATTIDDIPTFDLAAAYALYAALLKPVESAWGSARSVLIVPHLALGQLPFALLPTAVTALPAKDAVPFEGYREVAWLARRAAITQLPSVGTLVTLRRTPPGPATRRAYAGFGDPYFSKAQAGPIIATNTIGTRGALVKLRSAPNAGVGSTDISQLPRLPDTRDEILDVAKVMNADANQDVFLGERASMKMVKAAALGNRKVIHFATHGLVPGELDGLTQPALALTSPEIVGADGGDGLLKMEDILGLKLNADWVVLSACNTASADGSGSAEAVSGLGRAFFFAGARALLVSNWPVDSASARTLMIDVFRRQAADTSLDRAQALRQAMLQLIDAGAQLDSAGKPSYSYAHPLFWAPFTLVGDGAAR